MPRTAIASQTCPQRLRSSRMRSRSWPPTTMPPKRSPAGSPPAPTACSSCSLPAVPRPSSPRSFACMVAEVNWAGNVAYRARRLHRPGSVDELRAIVAAAPRIRALGTRHAFSDIGDSAELVATGGLPRVVEPDRAAGTVTVSGGLTYGELAIALDGLALHHLASLP